MIFHEASTPLGLVPSVLTSGDCPSPTFGSLGMAILLNYTLTTYERRLEQAELYRIYISTITLNNETKNQTEQYTVSIQLATQCSHTLISLSDTASIPQNPHTSTLPSYLSFPTPKPVRSHSSAHSHSPSPPPPPFPPLPNHRSFPPPH